MSEPSCSACPWNGARWHPDLGGPHERVQITPIVYAIGCRSERRVPRGRHLCNSHACHWRRSLRFHAAWPPPCAPTVSATGCCSSGCRSWSDVCRMAATCVAGMSAVGAARCGRVPRGHRLRGPPCLPLASARGAVRATRLACPPAAACCVVTACVATISAASCRSIERRMSRCRHLCGRHVRAVGRLSLRLRAMWPPYLPLAAACYGC